MLSNVRALARFVRPASASLALLAAAAMLAPARPRPQSADCAAFPKTLPGRQELIKQVNGLGKKANPKDACVLSPSSRQKAPAA
jgi:hypothetical protein